MADSASERLDLLAETDPLALRDEAIALLGRAEIAEAGMDDALKALQQARVAFDGAICRAMAADQRAEQAEAAVQRVRALAEELAALAPADDWGDDMPGTVAADVARRFLAALDRAEGT